METEEFHFKHVVLYEKIYNIYIYASQKYFPETI